MDNPTPYKPPNTLCISQNILSVLLRIQTSYTFCCGQNELSKHLQASYMFYLVKKGSLNFYKLPIHFAVVKNRLSEHLQATLSISKNGLSKPQLPSYTLCGSQNSLSKPLQDSYTRVVAVKTDSPNFYKLSRRFTVVKINSPNFYKPPTCLALVKTYSPNFYKLPTRVE